MFNIMRRKGLVLYREKKVEGKVVKGQGFILVYKRISWKKKDSARKR